MFMLLSPTKGVGKKAKPTSPKPTKEKVKVGKTNLMTEDMEESEE
jgi:hypothetical protein